MLMWSAPPVDYVEFVDRRRKRRSRQEMANTAVHGFMSGMRSVPFDVISRLDLEKAVQEEVRTTEPLIPPSPGAAELGENSALFVSWLGGQLRAGMPTGRGVVVAVEKPMTGSRPVAIWGFAERVTYRALTDLLLASGGFQMDRSAERYRSFISAPAVYAEELGDRPEVVEESLPFAPLWPYSAVVRYVVKADLASFYDYIDHDILGRELLIGTGEHAAIECLLDLLGEVQGRRYGLPQLLEPSDRLSDIYAHRVLRALRRKQWPAWRFNDDFRIAVKTFADAKRALDDLAAAARDNGLVLNESKTRTPSFDTYWSETTISQVDGHLSQTDARHDPADLVADYTEGARDSDPEWALAFFDSLVLPGEGETVGPDQRNLRDLDRLDTRYVRRALLRLADPGEPRAVSVLPKMKSIIGFVGSVTPYALQYLQAMTALDRPAVVDTTKAIITGPSLSSWQRICLLRTIAELDLLPGEPFQTWVMTHREQSFEPAVRAEAALTLATVNGIEEQEVIRALDQEPSALATWYLMALHRLYTGRKVTRETYDAVSGEGGLHAAILAQP